MYVNIKQFFETLSGQTFVYAYCITNGIVRRNPCVFAVIKYTKSKSLKVTKLHKKSFLMKAGDRVFSWTEDGAVVVKVMALSG